jgi:hypothetical protein
LVESSSSFEKSCLVGDVVFFLISSQPTGSHADGADGLRFGAEDAARQGSQRTRTPRNQTLCHSGLPNEILFSKGFLALKHLGEKFLIL